jgi:hypothetical protein
MSGLLYETRSRSVGVCVKRFVTREACLNTKSMKFMMRPTTSTLVELAMGPEKEFGIEIQDGDSLGSQGRSEDGRSS